MQRDFESRDVITIATESQLRLGREVEASKAKAEADERSKEAQRTRMNTLFARLAAEGHGPNPVGQPRLKNPFSHGRHISHPLMGAGESVTFELNNQSFNNREIVETIAEWTENESKTKIDGSKALQPVPAEADAKANMKIQGDQTAFFLTE